MLEKTLQINTKCLKNITLALRSSINLSHGGLYFYKANSFLSMYHASGDLMNYNQIKEIMGKKNPEKKPTYNGFKAYINFVKICTFALSLKIIIYVINSEKSPRQLSRQVNSNAIMVH